MVAQRHGDRARPALVRVVVLRVAQEVGRDETKPKVVSAVTVEVTPDQAEKLDLARSVGTLSLMLRNQVDLKMAGTDGATKTKLLNTPPEPIVTRWPRGPERIRSRAGGTVKICL